MPKKLAKKSPVKPRRSLVEKLPIPATLIERRIFLARRQKVMLGSDLADLSQVPTFRLNEAVKRNADRFPGDFMFQLTREEMKVLTSQIAMSKSGSGGRRTAAYAFTEQGVAMLSSVLKSERAVQVNIAIMRAFVTLREAMAINKNLAPTTGAFFEAIKKFIEPTVKPKRRIGFHTAPEMKGSA